MFTWSFVKTMISFFFEYALNIQISIKCNTMNAIKILESMILGLKNRDYNTSLWAIKCFKMKLKN